MNSVVKEFFIELGFDFNKSLSRPSNFFLTGDIVLKEKLKNKIFFFENPNQTNTSFYLITTPLQSTDFDILRKYIWNENKADLAFYTIEKKIKGVLFEDDVEIELLYSKASPTLTRNDCSLAIFKPSEKDIEKIKTINRWQFESGSFWLNYLDFFKKSTQKTIDKELVAVLNILKGKLFNAVAKVEKNTDKIEEVIQALIDRTLYIKYLEDNHIINSYFYTHYFKSAQIDYVALLENNKKKDLNKLFKIIHNTFNNSLFDKPNIEDEFLTDDVCKLIFQSLKGTNPITNQLRLFDFEFDVIPVEFISYIYEIFLSEKQKANGIYYTPKKLAQLIIDDVIIDDKVGKVLDPSCGSGMFLIVAFQKLLENSKERNYKDIEKRIEYRTKLLSGNIFGIEKEITAQRFTIFSLSLQLFRGLDPLKIKEYIANELKEKGKVDLFVKFDLYKNILHENTLDQDKLHFEGIAFDYIVGNPPFFEIKQTDEFKNETSFLNNYEVKVGTKVVKAKEIIGSHQISQCFLIKIKDWSNANTRFGFVSNSSNFYYDNSKKFQNFFYSEYNIEKIYELSKVKKILFEKAKESVVSVIFSNQVNEKNIVEYYPINMGIFSEKPFELLIIQEDKVIELKQKYFKESKIKLRDYLVGNEYDNTLITNINANTNILENYIDKRNDSGKLFLHTGLQIAGVDVILKSENITRDKYNLNRKKYLSDYLEKYTRNKPSNEFCTPLISTDNITPFLVKNTSICIRDILNFRRKGYNVDIYEGKKILWGRIGKSLQAIFSDKKIYFDFDIHVVKLSNSNLYYLFTALLNSQTVNYYINISLRKRLFDFHSKIDKSDFTSIPIPHELNEDLVKQISKISKDLTEGKYEYDKKIENKLNELIFDLYDLSYIEKQRIKDYFIAKEKVTKTKAELERYKVTLIDAISLFFKDKIEIEFSNQNHNPIVAKVYFSKKNEKALSAEKTAYYLLNEIFEQNPKENFLATQEKIYSKDCVYIIKDNQNISWTETKAYEDGQDILKHIR